MRSRGPSERRPGKNCSARCDAARRLGLDAPPPINPLAIRAIQAAGSKQRFIEYARLSDVEEVRGLVDRWDRLSPSDRRALSISDLCAAAGLRFSKLLGEVTAQAFELGTDVSGLIAAVSQPRVVEATVRSALRPGPDGARDRRMLLSHSGFLPVPKSATTIFQLQQQINSSHGARDDETGTLPSFSSDIITISATKRSALLTTGADGKDAAERSTTGANPRVSRQTENE